MPVGFPADVLLLRIQFRTNAFGTGRSMMEDREILAQLLDTHRREIAMKWVERVYQASGAYAIERLPSREKLQGWSEAFVLYCGQVAQQPPELADFSMLRAHIEMCMDQKIMPEHALERILAMPDILSDILKGEGLLLPMEEQKQVGNFEAILRGLHVRLTDHYAKQAVKHRNQVLRLTRVLDLIDSLHLCLEMKELTEVVALGIGNLVKYDFGILAVLSEANDLLRIFPFNNTGCLADLQYQLHTGDSIMERVIDSESATVIESIQTEPLHDVEAALFESRRLTNAVLVPISSRGKVIGAIGIFNEQTPREVMEFAAEVEAVGRFLGQLAQGVLEYEKLNTRMESLDHAVKEESLEREARSRAMEDITHDLKAPLSSVSGYTEMLLTEQLGGIAPRQVRALVVCRRNLDKLLCMINDMLDMARSRKGRLEVNIEPIGLDMVFYQCLDMLQANFAARKITCAVVVDDHACFVKADHDKIVRVMMNLVSNSLRHTPVGGEVTLGTRRMGGGRVEVMIRDTGSGIPQEALDTIFERFKQAGRASERKQGAGLGLSIAKAIVEAHDGRIRIESQEGVGTTIYFDLPAADPDDVILEP